MWASGHPLNGGVSTYGIVGAGFRGVQTRGSTRPSGGWARGTCGQDISSGPIDHFLCFIFVSLCLSQLWSTGTANKSVRLWSVTLSFSPSMKLGFALFSYYDGCNFFRMKKEARPWLGRSVVNNQLRQPLGGNTGQLFRLHIVVWLFPPIEWGSESPPTSLNGCVDEIG